MYKQMTIFDWMPDCQPEPPVGAWVRTTGAVIPHIMLKGHIGRKVCVNKSTESREIYRVGILEDYIPYYPQITHELPWRKKE